MSADELSETAAGAAPLESSEPTAPAPAEPQVLTAENSSGGAEDQAAPVGIAPWQVVLIVVALTLAAYRHVGANGYAYDDLVNIETNSDLNWDGIGRFWRDPYASMYIPVTYSFWVAEAELTRALAGTSAGPLDPQVFHYGNLLLHLAAVLLVFVWLRTLVDSWIGALAGAMLFALHPLQAETVNWITETKGSLAAVFGLTALLLFGRSAAGASPLRWLSYGAATLALGLALLSKPSAAAIPLIAGIVELFWNRRPLARVAGPLVVWFALVGVAAWWATAEQTPAEIRNLAPIAWRPLVAGDAISFYLAKLVWPSGLCLDYSRNPAWLVRQPAIFITWLLPAIVLGVLCLLPERRNWLVALAVFVAGLAPTLGLVPFGFQEYSTVADRYAYLAMLGPALALAFVLWRWPRMELYVPVGLLLLVAGVIDSGLTGFWQNQATVFSRVLKMNPGSVNGNLAIGNILVGSDKISDGIVKFRAGLKTDPGHPGLLGNLGCALEGGGENEEAAVVLAEAIRVKPDNPLAHVGMARLLARKGDFDGAIAEFELALQYDSRLPEAHGLLARSLADRGRDKEAVAHWREALRVRPDWALPALELAWLLSTSADDSVRNGDEAVVLAERCKKLIEAQAPAGQPVRDPLLREALAASYAEVKRFTESVQLLEQLRDDAGVLGQHDPAWKAYYAIVVEQLARVKQGQAIRSGPVHRLGIPGL